MNHEIFLDHNTVQNNTKNLDLSYKTDLEFLDCLEGKTVLEQKFHKSSLDIQCHSGEGTAPFYS